MMKTYYYLIRLGVLLLIGTLSAPISALSSLSSTGASIARMPSAEELSFTRNAAVPAQLKLDRSGQKRIGKASFYAKKFAGRKMADGNRMEPWSDSAASKTLPLGTIAKVTNIKNGQSALIIIRDRGPYVKGRIVDLSPSTAQKIGIKEQGVAKVEVAPVVVPQSDGSMKLGAASRDADIGMVD